MKLRKALLRWYRRSRRDLPWRATRDPYRIWVSEIMLQQTRVAAVLPYYEKFLRRFPSVEALAAAAEPDLLACWAGLGYYSRARNMQKAARQIAENGGFPRDYERIRALPGIGDYTAAAIASIAFGLPHAVLDGNVARVLARLLNDSGDIRSAPVRRRLQNQADALLEPAAPGDFNQAVMELGATVCLPRDPQCLLCPLRDACEARRRGRENELPVKSPKREPVRLERTLLRVERGGAILLWRRDGGGRMRGFWELPEAGQLPAARIGDALRAFRHTITHHQYRFSVRAAAIAQAPEGFEWIAPDRLASLPLSTVARKALA